jgi:acyl-homoserine lactone acylase PvdQ
MSLGVLPAINYVFADEKGNIGYVYNGRFPVRKEGVDWSGVVPGDRSDLVWTAQLPFEKMPQLWNPKSGFVFNSNNTPFRATDPADALKPEAFSKTLGIQSNMAQDEASPHYADQTPLFVGMKTEPVRFTEAQLKGHIAWDYRPPRVMSDRAAPVRPALERMER